MAIISKNLSREFRLAKEGGLSPGVVEASRPRLPRINGGEVGHPAGSIAYGQKMLEKMGTLGSAGSYGGADVLHSSPEIRNPLLNLINFYLPYDRKTLNQWVRYYDRFHPYVGNCLDIHGEFPISDFHFAGLSEKDKKVEQIFEEQKERANILQYCFEASREYELIGEVFAFWGWNDSEGMFDEYVIINPDLLDVKTVTWGRGKRSLYKYDPPQELKELAHDKDERMQEVINDLDPVVREALETNQPILLDDFNMMEMKRLASPYDSRGTTIVLRCIKELMYEDKLREAQYAIADQQITPVQIWKLGDPASGYMPTEEDLQDFRQLLLAGRHDQLFTIVSHGALDLDLVGYTGHLLPVIPEFEWVAKRILVGLYTNESMVTGDGPCMPVNEVETLTDRGWLFKDQIDPDVDKIATVNPVTDELEFHKPVDVVEYFYDSDERGPLVEFDQKWLQFSSTPNHRTWVSKGEVFGIVRADEVEAGYCVKNTVNWKGSIPKHIISRDGEYFIEIGGKNVNLYKYLAMAGLYIAEGSIEYERKRSKIAGQEWRSRSKYDYLRKGSEILPNAVRITQTKATQDSVRFDRIAELLSGGPYEPVYNQYETTRGWKGRFHFTGVELALHFRDSFGVGAINKQMPRWFLELPKEYLEVLFEALSLGDGYWYKNARIGEYDSTSEVLGNQVQELCIRLGLATRLKVRDRSNYKRKDGSGRETVYRVYYAVDEPGERRHCCVNPRLSKHHIGCKKFKGRVYCFEVPNHLYLVRCNGTVHVTGNTYSNAVVAMKVLQGRYQSKRDKIVNNIRRKIYKPISEAYEIWDTSKAELDHRIRTRRRPLLPDIEWNFKLELTDESQRINYLIQLRDKTDMPMKVICEVLNLKYETVKTAILNEQGSVFDPVYKAAREQKVEEGGMAGFGGVPGLEGGEGEVGGEEIAPEGE